MLGGAVRAGEERIAIERNRSDGALDDAGVELDSTVVEEAEEALLARIVRLREWWMLN